MSNHVQKSKRNQATKTINQTRQKLRQTSQSSRKRNNIRKVNSNISHGNSGGNRLSRTSSTGLVRNIRKNERFNSKFLGDSSDVPIVRKWEEGAGMDIKSMYHQEESHTGAHIVGTEFLDVLNVITTLSPLATQIGEVLDEIPIAPLGIEGTRLALMASLYQRFRINHFTIHYTPVVPAIQNGSLTMFTSYDPDLQLTTVPPGTQMNRVILSMETAIMFNVYDGVSVTWRRNPETAYWTRIADGNARLSIPALFYIISSSSYTPSLGVGEDLSLGNIWMSYDIEFYNMGLLDSVVVPTRELLPTLSTTLLNLFGYVQGVTDVDQEQVKMNNLPGLNLQAYTDPGYLLQCIVSGVWVAGPGMTTILFKTMKRDNVSFRQGVPFYMYFREGSWGVHASITSALNGDRDLTWSSSQSFAGLDTVVIGFSYKPITLL